MLLNDEAKTYAFSPIEDLSEYLKRARLAASRRPEPEPTGGDVTITIDAVDTGERRTVGPILLVIACISNTLGPRAEDTRSKRPAAARMNEGRPRRSWNYSGSPTRRSMPHSSPFLPVTARLCPVCLADMTH